MPTENADGSRTFTIPSDYADIDNIIWGHPVGVTVGDTLSGGGVFDSSDLTVNACGKSGSEVTITRVGCKAIDDNIQNFLIFKSCISDEATGNAVTINGASNKVYNQTVYSAGGHGIVLGDDADISNTVLNTITGTDIVLNGHTNSGSNNFIDSDGDPNFIDPANQDFGLESDSPLIDAGDDSIINTGDVDFHGRSISTSNSDIGAVQYLGYVALLSFNAKNKLLNFSAKNKVFNFNAANRG